MLSGFLVFGSGFRVCMADHFCRVYGLRFLFYGLWFMVLVRGFGCAWLTISFVAEEKPTCSGRCVDGRSPPLTSLKYV